MTASRFPNFDPAPDVTAKVTVLAEGTQGLTGVAMDQFSPHAGRGTAGLGARRQGGRKVPEAPPSHHPHDGLAAARRAQHREFGGSFIYPMGDDMVTVGMVVGLDYRDLEVSPTTCSSS